MAEQKHTHDPLNVDEALSTSEAFLLKYKNLLVGIVELLLLSYAAHWLTNILSVNLKS